MEKSHSYARNLLLTIAKEINKPPDSVEPFIKMFSFYYDFSLYFSVWKKIGTTLMMQ